jgi:hypothetical protein
MAQGMEQQKVRLVNISGGSLVNNSVADISLLQRHDSRTVCDLWLLIRVGPNSSVHQCLLDRRGSGEPGTYRIGRAIVRTTDSPQSSIRRGVLCPCVVLFH